MKLFFCDICNESIPLQDIKDNKATTIKGKIFCRNCNPLNELASQEPSPTAAKGATPAAGASGGMVAVLAFGLLVALGASGYLLWKLEFAPVDEGPAIATRLDDLERRSEQSRQLLSALSGNVEDLRGLRALGAAIEDLREDGARRRGEIEKLGVGLDAAEKNLNTVGALRERVDAATLRLDEFGKTLERVESAVANLDKSVREVADRPPVVVAPAPEEGQEGAEPKDEAIDEKLNEIIAKLKSPEEMVRWEGIDQIRREKAKALVPHVMQLLTDRSLFVRAQAIYTLGELKATAAVQSLIKLLRDDDPMIRNEALTALVEITAQNNLRYDTAKKDKAELERGAKRWDEWYAKNKDTL